MNEAEFDRFADEYRRLHSTNIRASGEAPEFFHEYKVKDTAALVRASHLRSTPRILDFGAGVGNSIPYFHQHIPGCDLTCLDVSRKCLAIAEQRFPGKACFVACHAHRVPFPDGSFDLVFSACVFHHIPPAAHAPILRDWWRVLRPGGVAVVFEHNPYNPLTVHAVKTCPFDNNAVLIPARKLLWNMRRAGFASPVRQYRIFFPGPLRALRRLEGYLTWLPLGAQYYVAAWKREHAL
jgi:SAM-dependent methyltransferase